MPPMLEIQLTVDDMVAYQSFFTKTQPFARKPLARQRLLLMPVFVLCAVAGFMTFNGSAMSWIFLVLIGAAAVFTWFWVPKTANRAMQTRTKRLYPSGVMPPTRFWLDGEGLNTESAGIRTHYAWSAIRQIDETPTHAFAWVGEMQAVVVPRRVGDLQVGPFIEALRASTEQARASQQFHSGVTGP